MRKANAMLINMVVATLILRSTNPQKIEGWRETVDVITAFWLGLSGLAMLVDLTFSLMGRSADHECHGAVPFDTRKK